MEIEMDALLQWLDCITTLAFPVGVSTDVDPTGLALLQPVKGTWCSGTLHDFKLGGLGFNRICGREWGEGGNVCHDDGESARSQHVS